LESLINTVGCLEVILDATLLFIEGDLRDSAKSPEMSPELKSVWVPDAKASPQINLQIFCDFSANPNATIASDE
jgi:hypothetical protein